MNKRTFFAALTLCSVLAFSSCMGNISGTEREKTESSLVQSYLTLAEESYESGDIEGAIETLEEGYSETADNRIKKRLDELRREYEGSETEETAK